LPWRLDTNRKKTYLILEQAFPDGAAATNSDVPILTMDFGDVLRKLSLVVEHYLQQERRAGGKSTEAREAVEKCHFPKSHWLCR